ncbi:hypothetical protein [Tsukamurella paurometabola]|uniref:Uncharacterized protein n=1 Tax=Tsukamurella paurometabola TaxID=2061 RepID=A0A3P8KBY9_TSUPA|nr:hypothetical protein [Tsukamurella paurometabola]UEA84492.1 hypothetical protein LK411_06625 [Tsukamurella paurometabola]VDR37058.1 Uncharacterised protein [Tsukamurella paurometabola]
MNDDQSTEDARISNATKTDGDADIRTMDVDVDQVDEKDDGVDQTDPTSSSGEQPEADQIADSDMFPRSYVEQLRQENGKYRQDARDAAARADDLAQRLHTAMVTATGKLADPTDLPFDATHLEDDGARLTQAIDDLLARKPHLGARRVGGDIGQGSRNGSGGVNLLGMLRGTNV